MATTYERITFRRAGGFTTTVNLRLSQVTDTRVSGFHVNAEGDEVLGRPAARRLFVIALTDIVKRVPLVLDKHYAVLVKAGSR